MVRFNASPFMVDHFGRIEVQVKVYIVEQLQNTSSLIEFDILPLFHAWRWLLCIVFLGFHSILIARNLVQLVFIITQ